MLYALILYQNAERKIRRLGESVSRGILVMLLTWASFSAMTSWTWCQPRDFFSCLSTTLKISGIVGGGPMLLCALGAGVLSGVLIIRKPKPRIE
jgi:polyferredoxin